MRIKIFLIGWLLLHPVVRSAAISVDSVWLALDSLSKRQLVQVAVAQRIDTTDAFKDAWNGYCQKRIEQSFPAVSRGSDDRSPDKNLDFKSIRLRCCHLFRSVPQSASVSQMMEERDAMIAVRQSLVVGQIPVSKGVGDVSLSVDTCCFFPECQPEGLEQVLDTLSLDEWSEPFVTPMGVHLLKVIDRDTLRRIGQPTLAHYQLDQLKIKHHYEPQQETIDLLFKGVVPEENVLFYIDHQAYTISTYLLFAASGRKTAHHAFHAFVKKSLVDAEVRQLFSVDTPCQSLLLSRDSLMIHHLLMKEVLPCLRDEVALESWYQAHVGQFRRPLFRGLVLHCLNKQQGRALRKFLKRLPEGERRHALEMVFSNNPIEAPRVEEGLFFEGDNPHVDAAVFHRRPVEPDAERPYIQLIGRKAKEPISYHEVRQEVMDAYQRELIQQLISTHAQKINVEK